MRLISVSLGIVVLVADIFTKWWVQTNPWVWYYTVVDEFFRINYVLNKGIAFGFFHSLQSEWKVMVLSSMSAVAVLIVLYYIWKTPLEQKKVFIFLGLILGGILGNFVDRLFNHHVTDFLEFHWGNYFSWPTFNLADAAITSGVIFIFYETIFDGGKEEQ